MPHLVIARRNESLAWLADLPAPWRVTIHNAGPALDPQDFDLPLRQQACAASLGDAALRIEAVLATLAGESPLNNVNGDITVFCPADPFEQAPDFLALLAQYQRFGQVQPLSSGSALARQLAEADDRDWIDELPVRAERYSLHTLTPLARDDDAALRAGRGYRRKHGLAGDVQLSAHFLRLIGLEALASQAEQADLGLYAYGGIFAVQHSALRAAQLQWGSQLAALRLLARADSNYPDIIERCWLHLFGLPFVSLAGMAPAPMAVAEPAAAPAMTRVVASIDAVLAQAGPERPRNTAPTFTLPLAAVAQRVALPVLNKSDIVTPEALPTIAEVRQRAQRALAQHDQRGAWRHLELALQHAPRDIDLLADATALAYREGDNERALNCARRALAVDPNHLDCLFTLGMCLAATGQAEQAMAVLTRLAEHPDAARWQAEHPEVDSSLALMLGQSDEPPTTARAKAQRQAA